MENTIITEYPLWFVAFCLLGGIAYAALLYFRSRKHSYSEALKWLLAVLRFLSVSVIAFLLLSPLLRSTHYEVEKPVIVFAQDNSSSIRLSGDSAVLSGSYQKDINALKKQLAEKYTIDSYVFGKDVRQSDSVTFTESTTDYGPLYERLNVNYANRNVGALVIASDGIYNQGINPLYGNLHASYELHTVGMGDPSPRKELRLVKVMANDIAFIGNEFPVEVLVNASMARGERTVLKVFRGNEKLLTREIRIDENTFSKRLSFYIKAGSKGLQNYSIELDELEGEKNTVNNRQQIYIDVLDDKSDILVLAHSPHPDLFAFKSALERSKRYDVKVSTRDEFSGSVQEYDLVILHQLPSVSRKSASMLATLFDENIPALFVLGEQTDIQFFNSLKTGLQIENTNGSTNEALPAFNKGFTLFKTDVRMKNLFKEAPPLKVPFGDYTSSPAMYPYLYQKLDDYTTGMPLISLTSQSQQKTGVITGTGLWKWRLRDYVIHENHKTFYGFINKLARYLILNRERSLFRVDQKNRYAENEDIIIDAELYNASYELVNEPEVKLSLKNERGETFEYVFDRTSDKYRLNAGMLETGTYSYIATTRRGGESYEEKGRFVVTPVNLEARDIRADHSMLQKLAQKYGGTFFKTNQLSELADTLHNSSDIKPVRYANTDYEPLIDMEWILVFILVVLSTEWFLRKLYGGY